MNDLNRVPKTTRRSFVLMLLLFVAFGFQVKGTTSDPLKRIIVHGSPSSIEKARQQLGGAILDGYPGAYLLAVNQTLGASDLAAVERAFGVFAEEDSPIKLSGPEWVHPRSTSSSSTTAESTSSSYYTSDAPNAYVNQAAALKLQLPLAHQMSTGRNAVVAIIDTGVDTTHPVLKNSLLPGRNYVVPSTDPAEWNDYSVDQSDAVQYLLNQSDAVQYLLDQSDAVQYLLNQSDAVQYLLDQSDAVHYLLDSMPPAFGHGTMVSGIVHLVAPEALIMPMKAFDASGTSSLWNLVRAVNDAVADGADVINLSFSSASNSKLLRKALQSARSRGVVIVAAAGNDNTNTPTFPAALPLVMGVTSLRLDDSKAGFSNYGNYIDVSGPGVGLITTYPGSFAIVAGTSFTAPLVSGELALLGQFGLRGADARSRVERTSDSIDASNAQYKHELGQRMNVVGALRAH